MRFSTVQVNQLSQCIIRSSADVEVRLRLRHYYLIVNLELA
jgi:hypothetical protein